MKLKVELSGSIEHIVITAQPQVFLARIFKHCLGKNNTPYFANNCFKGILYFDFEFAQKLAEGCGHVYREWSGQDRFYNLAGASFESSTQIVVRFADEALKLTSSEVVIQKAPLNRKAWLDTLSDDEVMLVLGSLDKGADSFVLEEAGPDIDLEGLTLRLDTFEDFGLENRIVSAVSLGGQELLRQPGKRLGRNMLTPKIIAKNGRELELFDFME